MTTNLSFPEAVIAVKDNHRIARAGWNGKGMYVFLVRGDAVKQAIHNCYGDPSVDAYDVCDALYMFTANKELVPWVASQADVLATDWEIV